MTLFPDYSDPPNGRAILLSVKPRFADLIVSGTKRVELRRAVPAQSVDTIALYSSSPVQAIIALVDVRETIEANPSTLWKVARDNGGGLTRMELRTYFESKKTGFALMLENVRVFDRPVDPKTFFNVFTPPQFFKYLTEKELRTLVELLKEKVSK